MIMPLSPPRNPETLVFSVLTSDKNGKVIRNPYPGRTGGVIKQKKIVLATLMNVK